MSLVAYAASSDEDSENEEIIESQPIKLNIETTVKSTQNGSKSLSLPQPKTIIDNDDDDEVSNLKLNLPKPKKSQNAIIEEKDDEFLHKKVAPSLVERPIGPKKPAVRQPVRITIPSLAEFEDKTDVKGKTVTVAPNPSKPNTLLGMLPPPKFAATLGRSQGTFELNESTRKTAVTKTTSLIPHTVANKIKQNAMKPATAKTTNLGLSYNSDDSDDDDDDGGDFFSLHNKDKLPEVSESEIKAMVTKKAARMAEFSKNLTKRMETATNDAQMEIDQQPSTSKLVNQDEINIEALVGTRAAKRARKGDIQFIDISQDQVKLNQEEWLRNQLTSETEYQPTGRLVGDGPGAGTKKKHQITYLAYQAKANEQELQAMWAANRHTRRQTQSKYGF